MTLDVRPSRSEDAISKEMDSRELTSFTAIPNVETTKGQPMTYRGVSYTKATSGRYSPDKVRPTRRSRVPLLQWFYDLPVRHKQILGLITSEVISVLGLVGVGSLLIIGAGRAQLQQQARSELAVAQIQYDIKINQMGFGFRGQSDNAAIIDLAQTVTSGFQPSERQLEAVEEILQNEISARNIEYATLVGQDGIIIASANSDRQGEAFDPDGLVSRVLRNPQQIKTTAIVDWEELQREDPPLPAGISGQDALIRYTVTPVFEPDSNDLIGVLVSGDIVNGKLPIVEETVAAFDSGYAAVYHKNAEGTWQMATSADLDVGEDDIESFEPLYDESLLEDAVTAGGDTVTRRLTEADGEDAGSSYTMAARTIEDFNGEPIAVLVRGASEYRLEQLIQNTLLLQFGIATLALLVDIILAQLLGRSIVSPLKRLQKATEAFAGGDRRVRAEVYARDEVGQVATAFNELANTMAQSEASLIDQSETQTQSAQRERQLANLITHMRESLDSEKVFRTVVKETRSALVTDRVVVFMFDEDWKGTITAESVERQWPTALGAEIKDPCFAERYVEQYLQGRIQKTPDVLNAGLTNCHLNQLTPFEVRANLVAPILVDDRLLGLLIAHECKGPRDWSDLDVSFFQQAAMQLGYTLEQVNLFNQREQARLEAEALSEERRQRQETLQLQLLNLLEDVEGASDGDLTVRADVTTGEIGTVADFFNSIVESLRQIVTQVKDSAQRVNTALGDNETAIQTLTQDAMKQADQTTQTLSSVEAMTQSITEVADQAQQAAAVAKAASETAADGGTAIDLTVQNIFSLRTTVGETAKKVKRLGEASQQISKVVSLINQIAMQTNLLAINAGIEAARAGEEGQGFAAVAEEVTELAARSAAATQEIERIVENIQRETSDVVEAIESSTAQVVEGTHQVEAAKQSLTQVLEVSQQIDALAQSISTATVSQVDTAQTVSALMQEIAEVSERTSGSSNELSTALKQTVEVAQELESSMATFRLS